LGFYLKLNGGVRGVKKWAVSKIGGINSVVGTLIHPKLKF
jgi:hypothetical protein